MKGKHVLITGATNGIGKQAALDLAKLGAAVTIVGRDEIKTRKVSVDIKILSGSANIDLLIADLSSMEETRRIAAEFLEKHQRLDVLLNNAGAMFSEYRASVDGYEMTFALNHFGYYLLSNLLLDLLTFTAREQGEARIINVSSGAHKNGALSNGMRLDNLRDQSGFGGSFRSYSVSKLANVLFTYELARRLDGAAVTVNALHPGFVRTGIRPQHERFDGQRGKGHAETCSAHTAQGRRDIGVSRVFASSRRHYREVLDGQESGTLQRYFL